MIEVYPSDSRFTSNHGWLKTSHSFSFANYYDPNNMNFGPMRVLNDDIVQPSTGFGEHPHREMEIVSLVLRGQLQHTDSTGSTQILRPGEVQRMSAGTGVIHSEMNPSDEEEVNFLQLWFEPGEKELEPSYEQIAYDESEMNNQLLPIVSNKDTGTKAAYIHQDMTIYLSHLDAKTALEFSQEDHRRVFLFNIEGDLTIGDHTLKRRDAARIVQIPNLSLQTEQGSYFMLIDLP